MAAAMPWMRERACAQENGPGMVSGRLLDTVAHQEMEGASVRLLAVKGPDTSVVAAATAGSNGQFVFRRLPLGNYLLSVSFQGYQQWRGHVALTPDRPVLTRRGVYLKPTPSELDSIVVRDTRPVVVRGDTTAYQADQFHTRPNAALGDLIQKMPGLDVSRSGTIMAMGDTVKRILVNGKRFFSNNLHVALKYLPRDIIAQIEIFDDKSDQSKFTGVDDGVRIKTINIILKKSITGGTFGKVSAGIGDAGPGDAGTNDGILYNDNVSLNRFHGESLTTLIGNAQNTQPVMGGQTRDISGGLNFADHWGKSSQVSGSYMENNTLTNTALNSYTQNLIPGDSSLYNTQQQNSRSNANVQHLDLNMETELDSADHLTVRGNGGYNTNGSSARSITSSTSGLTTPLNNSDNTTGSASNTANGALSVLWGHRFAKRGRTFSIAANGSVSHGTGSGANQYLNTYFLPGQPDSVAAVNQFYQSPHDQSRAGVTVSYTEPLSRRSSLLLNYHYDLNTARTGRTTFLYDSAAGAYNLPDSLLTNLFHNRYTSQREGLNYHLSGRVLQVTAGMGLQEGYTNSLDLSNGTDIRQRYVNLYPLGDLNYIPAKGQDLKFDYQGQTTQPSLSALEPLINNSNPLNVTVGNPNLKQAFTHNMELKYTYFNRVTFQHFFATVNAHITENTVVNKTSVNELTGVDTTTYTNLDGDYRLSAYLDYGFRLLHPASNLSFGLNLADAHTVGYINQVLNGSHDIALGGTVRWTSNLPDHLDLNASFNPVYNIAIYSAEPAQNTRYLTQNLDLDGLYYTKSGWELGSVLHYTAYSGRPAGFNTTTAVWDLSLAHLFFSRQQGEVKFTVHDLLDQAASVSRSISASAIQDSEGKMLGRYYMLTFTYNLKGAGKRGGHHAMHSMPQPISSAP